MLTISKVENGFLMTDEVTGKIWIARGIYDISDICRTYFKEEV